MPPVWLLSIDQGTTSTRAVVFDADGRSIATASQEFAQHYPQPGWVEHDADDIWDSVVKVVRQALAAAGAGRIAAIGITNQRETAVFWDRLTGRPAGRAIVWQDRRTADFCNQQRESEGWLQARTGLLLDPYFSATKFQWALRHQSEARDLHRAGRLALGTVDSFLIWRLTAGRIYATDVSNASRTLLMNLETGSWDAELGRYFGIPVEILPEIRPSVASFGETAHLDFLPDGVPIFGVAGDQQASLFGQCGFTQGDSKCTYGTGAFFLQHTGETPVRSKHRLLTTVAATPDPKLQYALEGSVFIAGAAVQWLRDGLGIVESAAATEQLAALSNSTAPIVFVPALVGFGAPHWAPETRGTLFGITRGTTTADLARATLEGVACQVVDLLTAAGMDLGTSLPALRVDGGMARNAWFLQLQADLLGVPVLESGQAESTALGAAFLAGLGAGVWGGTDALRQLNPPGRRFEPRLSQEERERRLARWARAVRSAIAYYQQAD